VHVYHMTEFVDSMKVYIFWLGFLFDSLSSHGIARKSRMNFFSIKLAKLSPFKFRGWASLIDLLNFADGKN